MAKSVAAVVVLVRSFLLCLFSSQIAAATPTGIPSLRPRLPNDTLCNRLILPAGYPCSEHTVSLSLSPELVFQYTTINSLPTKHSLIFYFQKLFFFFPILATCDHVSFEDFPYKNVFLHLVISIIGSNKGWLLTGPSSRVFSYWEYKRTTGSSGSASAWTLHGKLSLSLG